MYFDSPHGGCFSAAGCTKNLSVYIVCVCVVYSSSGALYDAQIYMHPSISKSMNACSKYAVYKGP